MELIDKITELLDEIKMDGNKFYQKVIKVPEFVLGNTPKT